MPFESVLTLCRKCREPINVKAEYADRNKAYKCKGCSALNSQ